MSGSIPPPRSLAEIELRERRLRLEIEAQLCIIDEGLTRANVMFKSAVSLRLLAAWARVVQKSRLRAASPSAADALPPSPSPPTRQRIDDVELPSLSPLAPSPFRPVALPRDADFIEAASRTPVAADAPSPSPALRERSADLAIAEYQESAERKRILVEALRLSFDISNMMDEIFALCFVCELESRIALSRERDAQLIDAAMLATESVERARRAELESEQQRCMAQSREDEVRALHDTIQHAAMRQASPPASPKSEQ